MLHRWSPRSTVHVVASAGPTGVASNGTGSGCGSIGAGGGAGLTARLVVVVEADEGGGGDGRHRAVRWAAGTAGRVVAATDPTTPSEASPAAHRRIRPGPRRSAARARRSSRV